MSFLHSNPLLAPLEFLPWPWRPCGSGTHLLLLLLPLFCFSFISPFTIPWMQTGSCLRALVHVVPLPAWDPLSVVIHDGWPLTCFRSFHTFSWETTLFNIPMFFYRSYLDLLFSLVHITYHNNIQQIFTFSYLLSTRMWIPRGQRLLLTAEPPVPGTDGAQ